LAEQEIKSVTRADEPAPLLLTTLPSDRPEGLFQDQLSTILVRAIAFDGSAWWTNKQSSSNAVPVIVLDATIGIRDIDIYNAKLVRLLSLGGPLVLVDRMIEIGFEQEQFELIEEEFREQLKKVELEALCFVPGPVDNLAEMKWFVEPDPHVLVRPEQPSLPEPLRITVSSSFKAEENWCLTGTLVSGTIREGDKVLCSPSNHTAIVGKILEDGTRTPSASNPAPRSEIKNDAATLSLHFDEPFYADEGEILSHEEGAPIETDVFCVRLYLSEGALSTGDRLSCSTKLGTFEAHLESIENVLDPLVAKAVTHEMVQGETFAEIKLRTAKPISLDAHMRGTSNGLIQLSLGETKSAGVGLISMDGYADQRQLLTPMATNTTPVANAVSDEERRARNGHDGGVLWFTGLSGSGKSTLAMALEARLFAAGYQVFVLDGDNVRQGLTSNLGFSPDDRAENIRRVGEVAALFRQAGVVVISSFISPYRSDRDRARHAAQSGFHEVFIKADVETCIARDPKGLYEKALKGDIRDFTGISAPYEEPVSPELSIDTAEETIDACVEQLVNYVDRNFRL
jgi:bifunctional enzyme CysN/CysC